jgi:pyruvate/2-oxoglutarate dehydrogenase complex dihydrolipoamide dehydrogenase (E3) component
VARQRRSDAIPGAIVEIDRVVGAVAPTTTRERMTALGIRIVDGTARFRDHRSLEAGGTIITARRFIIATGSSPLTPPIPGLNGIGFLTGETVADLREIPPHPIVVGAGAIGLELAQAFGRFGSQVTVLDVDRPLAHDEAECSAIVLDALALEGVDIRGGTVIDRVAHIPAAIRVTLAAKGKPHSIDGSHILVAAGRRPNLGELNLAAAGIRFSSDGIVLDRVLRTTNRRVYAIGDAAGGPHRAHVAGHRAALVVRHALNGEAVRFDAGTVPTVIYTDPQLAQVGLREDAARARHGAIRVLRWPFRDNDRTQAQRAIGGHIKVITGADGAILGATIVGRHAAEGIAAWTLAVAQKLNISAFAELVLPYPTFAEVGKKAAATYLKQDLTPPPVRRIINWLRR